MQNLVALPRNVIGSITFACLVRIFSRFKLNKAYTSVHYVEGIFVSKQHGEPICQVRVM